MDDILWDEKLNIRTSGRDLFSGFDVRERILVFELDTTVWMSDAADEEAPAADEEASVNNW